MSPWAFPCCWQAVLSRSRVLAVICGLTCTFSATLPPPALLTVGTALLRLKAALRGLHRGAESVLLGLRSCVPPFRGVLRASEPLVLPLGDELLRRRATGRTARVRIIAATGV